MTMSGSESQPSSLFAGMNIGETARTKTSVVRTPISSGQNKAEPTFLQRKHSKDSADKTIHLASSGGTGGSSFSFIKQNEPVEQTSAGVQDVDNAAADKTSLLELFESLDGGDSHLVGDENLLSYSDQLAEILPMSTPVGDTSMSMSDSLAIDMEHDEAGVSLQDGNKDAYLVLDFSSEDVEEEEETNVDCDSKDEEATVATSIGKDVEVSKYDLVLEPEDKLSLFSSQHSFKLTKLRNEKEELQRNLCLVYEDVKNKIVSLETKLGSLRTKFDEVLSNDDYDSAAEINEKIEQLTNEKYEIQSARPGLLNSKVRECLNRASIFMEKEVSFHEWALSKYNELESEQNDLLFEHRRKCTKEVETTEQELKNQKDDVNRTLEHLQLDKEHTETDRAALDIKINAQLEVFQDRKDELVGKQRCLEGDIEKLEKRLEELKSESRQMECAIKGEENKMNEARKEFEPLETKLRKEHDEILAEEETLKAKLEKVEHEEKDLEAAVFQNKDKEESLLKNISDLVAKRTESEALVQACQKETDTEEISDAYLIELTEDKTTDNLEKLRALEKVRATELQDLELEVFNMERKITMKKKRLDDIKSKVPELQKGKKTAVSEHNFKEAKRLNEIVKQLSTEAETTEVDVQEMEDNLIEETEKVAALKEEYGKLKKDVLTAKESHDLNVFITVMNRIKLLAVKEEKSDSVLETLRKAELDLLKTEFDFLDVPSESAISEMSDVDQRNLAFVKTFLKSEEKSEDNIQKKEDDRR